MKYKLLLLDIDGTLVEPKRGALPSKRVISAIKKAKKFTNVSVVTGRPVYLALPVIEKFELDGLSIFEGGAEIVDLASNKIVHKEYVSLEQMRDLFKLGKSFNLDMYSGADMYTDKIVSENQIKTPTPMFFIRAVSSKIAPNIMEELSAVQNVAIHTSLSWVDGEVLDLHITHVGATKRSAVEKLTELLGCEQDEIMGIGDWYNDAPMFEVAGFSVAMGDAPDELKALADFVAPALAEDGAAVAIEKFILTN
jgi:HAD superfamily hydrolase (TIGR01484 family)